MNYKIFNFISIYPSISFKWIKNTFKGSHTKLYNIITSLFVIFCTFAIELDISNKVIVCNFTCPIE